MTSDCRIMAVIQARMSSARLPGKALRPLAGRAMLGLLVDRLRGATALDGIVVATSIQRSDDAIAAFCAVEGIDCVRGSLEDVAGRMLQAAEEARADAFLRISGDSPLMDPAIADRAARLFREARPGLVSNVVLRSFPKGQSVEVIDTALYRTLMPHFETAEDREHVTPFLYRHPTLCPIRDFRHDPPLGALQLSVDTQADLDALERILLASGRPAATITMQELIGAAEGLGLLPGQDV